MNQYVTDAINKRTVWLDEKMHEESKLKIGDEIWDLDEGCKLGNVSKLKRWWRGELGDTSLSYYYEFQTGPYTFDNTSRVQRSCGTKKEAAAEAKSRYQELCDD